MATLFLSRAQIDAITKGDRQSTRTIELLIDLVNSLVAAGVTVPASVVASLPAAASNTGTLRLVTDALAPVTGNIVANGGAVRCLVNSDGTNWRVT